jgi:hypothetical protein
VYRSFYGMRIPEEDLNADDEAAKANQAQKKTIDRGVTKTGTSGVGETPGVRANKSTR